MSDTHDINSPGERLRARPEERFGHTVNMISIPEALQKLKGEATPLRQGHRQITLDQLGPMTIVLFAFEEGGTLHDHKAAGVVTIQGIEGELTIRTEDGEYKLSPSMMVVLAPNVRHSVSAAQAGAMLLTVYLVPNQT